MTCDTRIGEMNNKLYTEGSLKKSEDEEVCNESWPRKLETTLAKLKQQVQSTRNSVIMDKMESNRVKLLQYTSRLIDYTKRWAENRPQESLSKYQRVVVPSDGADEREDGLSTAIPVIFSSSQSKQNIRAVKLALQQNVPAYTTWIYLDRNQRMTEDQSVQGRRRIYYDPVGNETLIASDSEEEEIEEEEVKHEFSKGEDYIIWMTVQECGVDERVFEHIAETLDVNCDEVQARYVIMATDVDKQVKCEDHGKGTHTKVIISPSGRRKVTRDQGRMAFKEALGGLDAEASQKHGAASQPGKSENIEAKDLAAAMDSFDNLFCRRCLVFDCRLHGCSQPLVHPSERQQPMMTTPDAENSEPCGPNCYKLLRKAPSSQTQTSMSFSLASSSSNVCETSFSVDGVEKVRATKRRRIQEERTSWSADMQLDIPGPIVPPVGETASKEQTGLEDACLAEAGVELVHVGSKTEKRTGMAAEIAAAVREQDAVLASDVDVVVLHETKRRQKNKSRLTPSSKGGETTEPNGLSKQLEMKLKFVESEQGEGKTLNDDADSRDRLSEKTVCEISSYTSQMLKNQHLVPTYDSKRNEDTCSKDPEKLLHQPGSLARKLRKSTEMLLDQVEIDASQNEAGSLQDYQPQKEDRSRSTAAKKLARSSRNSIVHNFSAQHQRLLMQMDQKRGIEENHQKDQQGSVNIRVTTKSQSLGLTTADQSHVADDSINVFDGGDGVSIPIENKKRSRPPDTGKPKKVERREDRTPLKPSSVINLSEGELTDSHVITETSSVDKWTPLEKGLCEKGLQIFGRSSCLLAKTMLKGCKTCAEVADYISAHEKAAIRSVEAGTSQFADSLGCMTDWDNEIKRARAKFFGKKKGSRRLKFTLKSAGQSAVRKRMNNGKDLVCRQFTPCGCLFSCGKQCPCQLNGTCCEKYCGCAKGCKNRFRGCHCAKSQCCSRQCPCFAAGRECDPDVCRNCWIGCGDGNSVCPPQREEKEHYTCHNMKLLLKQQQRVLLSRSDVAGWGAFLKNTVNKHEYLGEYTGELISHREADKRGKIYDRENSSFLFNLNDQYVLDACRKGDKLKFANHSPNPNCYAKVIMVAGDHRVGIFAKERIMAGEELFYDYRYEADRAPSWAKRGDDGGNGKKEDTGTSSGRGTKQAS
ncbi:hypothetical protein R1flu_008932 [Riccia fluitans]|uniref:[Histone H3]-lysine(27) N-trimethyltransferase n=1 Tax=Riccia fluitans TaxID=41844 RepID=A0ABD1Z1H9_9MARC